MKDTLGKHEYKIVFKGAPIGVIKSTAKKHGELIEFEGITYYVQYTKGKAIFVGEDKGVKKKYGKVQKETNKD